MVCLSFVSSQRAEVLSRVGVSNLVHTVCLDETSKPIGRGTWDLCVQNNIFFPNHSYEFAFAAENFNGYANCRR